VSAVRRPCWPSRQRVTPPLVRQQDRGGLPRGRPPVVLHVLATELPWLCRWNGRRWVITDIRSRSQILDQATIVRRHAWLKLRDKHMILAGSTRYRRSVGGPSLPPLAPSSERALLGAWASVPCLLRAGPAGCLGFCGALFGLSLTRLSHTGLPPTELAIVWAERKGLAWGVPSRGLCDPPRTTLHTCYPPPSTRGLPVQHECAITCRSFAWLTGFMSVR
jgi:hypothetical protein